MRFITTCLATHQTPKSFLINGARMGCLKEFVMAAFFQVSGWNGAKQLHAGGHGEAIVYKGMIDCFSQTIREEGVQALFKARYSPLC
jgi:hypothetical protein